MPNMYQVCVKNPRTQIEWGGRAWTDGQQKTPTLGEGQGTVGSVLQTSDHPTEQVGSFKETTLNGAPSSMCVGGSLPVCSLDPIPSLPPPSLPAFLPPSLCSFAQEPGILSSHASVARSQESLQSTPLPCADFKITPFKRHKPLSLFSFRSLNGQGEKTIAKENKEL